jgi:hypothetical protein
MNLSALLRYLLLCAVLPLLSSCATTELTSVWRDPAYQDHPRKIMVLGMLPVPGNKRIFEDEMVRKLREQGTDAFASYPLLPEQPAPDREGIEKVMREQGADAVLIARLMDKKTVTSYVPPPPPPPRPMYGAAPSYYGSQWQGYYAYQGSVRQDEYTVVQTNLYDLKSEKLIWTAASETWMSEDSVRLILSFIDVIVKKMARDQVIAPGKGK